MDAIFLLGSMGSGKSTILSLAEVVRSDKYITHCKDFDILGSEIGADSLSKYKKADVLKSLANYKGERLVIAGIYYSSAVDIERLTEMGFNCHCILLDVPRDTVYKRVLKRGNGGWNEKTYAANMKRVVSFFKRVRGERVISPNVEQSDLAKNYKLLLELGK